MPKTTQRRPGLGGPRSRLTALLAGFGVSITLGAGAAVAAGADGGADIFAAGTAAQLAEATRYQADQQDRAASTRQAEEKAELRAAETKKKSSRHARRAARQVRAHTWEKPVTGSYELSAGFGNSGGRWAHRHSGQDFAVPTGTGVRAAHGGTVVKAGPNGAGDGPAYGNAIVVRHGPNTYSQYAHLSKIQVHVGQHVRTGQPIARSGSTGNSSGPHLHFEVRATPDYGSAREPLEVLREHGVHL